MFYERRSGKFSCYEIIEKIIIIEIKLHKICHKKHKYINFFQKVTGWRKNALKDIQSVKNEDFSLFYPIKSSLPDRKSMQWRKKF